MFSNRHSILLALLMICAWAIQTFGLPSFSPNWLNDALATMFLFLGIVSFCLLIILPLYQNQVNTQGVVIGGLDVSPLLTIIDKHMYPILFGVAVLAFVTGAWLSPVEVEITSQKTPNHKTIVKVSDPVEIDKDDETPQVEVKSAPRTPPTNIVRTPEASTPRVFTPRTPKELINMAEKETRRDAMKHKGTWIHVEGPVLDISEAARGLFNINEFYIKLEVKIESPPHYLIPRRVNLYVKADTWEKQVDKIERGDWLVARGIVYQVYKLNMDVIDGEIISVSGPSKGRK